MNTEADFSELLEQGCKVEVVSTRHLVDLLAEIESRRSQNQFDPEFAKDYLYRFDFAPPQRLSNAKSIVVVAMPRPITQAVFQWDGKKQTFTLPPTYTAYDQKRMYVESVVEEAVGKKGYRVATTNLPLKLLAVRSGLAEYGRNNIAYVKGMGSFMRLTAVYTDMPLKSGYWQAPKVMEQCAVCGLCQRACPTGAISQDRFLLYAEKCITYHNEKDGKIPFPSWIKPQWHNAIVGCIRCQAACPENKPYLTKVGETVEFNEEETSLLLKGIPLEEVPMSTAKKLVALGLTDYYNALPRNLSVLLTKEGQ